VFDTECSKGNALGLTAWREGAYIKKVFIRSKLSNDREKGFSFFQEGGLVNAKEFYMVF
jgi:hypothetical protein